jgi:hypothetical protein
LTITDNSNNVVGSTQTVSLAGTGNGAAITFSPASPYNFGSVTVGTSSSVVPITVTNTGNATLTISNFTGSNGTEFTQTNNCSASLAAGANCTFNVTFTPTATGLQTATGTFTDNAPGSPQVYTVEGTGVSGVSFSSSSLTFSGTNVGSTSTAQSTTLTNTGTGTLTISGISITGTNAGDFSQTNTCGGSVAAGGTCSISVSFTPTASGTRTASVAVADNLAGSPQTVALTGTGNGPAAGFSTTTVSFGNQGLSQASTALPVILTNSGNATLTVSSVAISGTNPGDFTQTNNCTSVAASGTCTINVTFTPAATGSRTATMTITDNANNVAGTTQTVSLTGTGTAGIAGVSPTGLTFGNQSIDTTSAAQMVTLTNSGNAALSITSTGFTGADPQDFGVSTTCGSSVAANTNCTISVTFEPTVAGTRTATLTITDNSNNVAGSTQTVSLTGTGIAASVTLSTTSLTFSSQTVGTSSASQSVTLNNTSTTATLAITSVAVSANFSQTNTCGSSVAPSTSCTISVTFLPTASGTLTGTLTITDGVGTQTVSLSGTGTTTNTVPVSVNLGINNNYANGIFTTVTVCSPGSTTNCATIPDVLVDTGSVGLRILASNAEDLSGNLLPTQVSSLNLPAVTDPTYNYPMYECVEYGDLSVTWGTVNLASVTIGSETAAQVPGGTVAGVPIQVITSGEIPEFVGIAGQANTLANTYYNPCWWNFSYNPPEPTGGYDDNTVANLGSNGILGVGNFPQDCSVGNTNGCAPPTEPVDTSFQYMYCSSDTSNNSNPTNGSNTCFVDALPVVDQVWNPVAAFPSDNNGISLTLPAISSSGAATATGVMTFGIGTQANNALPNGATVYELDEYGYFPEVEWNGIAYYDVGEVDGSLEYTNPSFLDSGSNTMLISDATTLNSLSGTTGVSVADCASNSAGYGLYCLSPTSSLLNLTGTLANPGLGMELYGNNSSQPLGVASVSIFDGTTLFTNCPGCAAFNDVAVDSGSDPSTDFFDFGLPFFYGKPYGVWVGISGSTQTSTQQYSYGFWAF